MADSAQKYEVFIESVDGAADNQVPLTNWSWHRLDARGRVVVRGSLHRSLEACFAAVNCHSSEFGQVPVKINLHEPCCR